MTRKEQIEQAATESCQHLPECKIYFEMGAKWADKNPHWISVVDDLPPIQDKGTYSDLVLVCGTKGEIDTAKYSYMSNRWQCNAVLLTVTHWMPLPAPPRKGGKQ